MKKILTTSILAFASLAFLLPNAGAALTYNSDDLVVAFSTGPVPNHTGKTYLIDFGNLSSYIIGGSLHDGVSHVVNTGFGANWLTDLSTAGISLSTGTYSIQSANDANGSLTISKARSDNAVQSTPFGNGSSAGAGGDIQQMLFSLGTAANPSVAPNSFIQNTTDDSSYSKFVFGTLSPTQAYEKYSNPEGTFSQKLDLYAATNSGTGNTALVGTFTFDSSNGNLSFQSIPEPSTYALLGISAVGLYIATRLRKNASV